MDKTNSSITPNSVSIAICCYNSESQIEDTLDCVGAQKVPDNIEWELIVINNHSSDNTSIIVEQWIVENPHVDARMVDENNPGLIYARLCALRQSKYDIISFVDDDNRIKEDWVYNISNIMSDKPDVGICSGRTYLISDIEPPEWFNDVKAAYAVGKQGLKSGYVPAAKGQVWGAGMSVRKKAWEDMISRGFTHVLVGRKGVIVISGEDAELCLAMMISGWKLWYEDDLILGHHIKPDRLEYDYAKNLYFGFGCSNPVLRIYREILLSKKPLHPWASIFLNALYLIRRYILLILCKEKKRKVVYSLYMKHLLGMIFYCAKNGRELSKLRKRIKHATWNLKNIS